MRMRAHRRVNVSVLFREIHRSLKRAAVRIAGADVENCANACVSRPCDKLMAIGVVFGTVNVGVGIYKAHLLDEKAEACSLRVSQARLVFGEFATSESLKSQRTILRIYGNLPRFHRNSSDDCVEIMAVRFAKRVDWHDHRVEV